MHFSTYHLHAGVTGEWPQYSIMFVDGAGAQPAACSHKIYTLIFQIRGKPTYFQILWAYLNLKKKIQCWRTQMWADVFLLLNELHRWYNTRKKLEA